MTATSVGLATDVNDPARQLSTVQVVLVELPDCHLCEQAKVLLADLGRDFSLQVQVLEAGSEAGRALIARHRPTMAPLVLLDGEFFSSGRLPRNKLVSRLRVRGAARVGSR